MKHYFKFAGKLADLMINNLDLSAKTIDYSVREKETGVLLEPHFKSKLLIHQGNVIFDTNRTFSLDLAKHIEGILKSE